MSRRVDLRLYVVLDEATTPPAAFAELAEAAVAGGATAIQLRDKRSSARSLIALAQAVRARLHGRNVPVIVNDRADLALAAGADGVHLGQDDLPAEYARAILGEDAIIGLSVTCEAEIGAVDPALVDHVGLGPIFPTGTKPDAAPALGPERFATIRRQLDLPVVAIGGIGQGNVAEAIRAGADGVAVVSAVARAADPTAAARALMIEIERAGRESGRQ
ncbi:MAG TPA: thiamine phosphate synthase [Geminicoccus sp.]|uniref:thiamine phosphate synthase n=1 Tax=Geminicoccus sp. TaxID=2024832 RepID=UPI002C34169E|nr:thiamine phosphate synthase [Geminicoccus sp.]HWL71577.1 thiamine phosphate synthase [Geminicoccus sp.]